MPPPVRLYNRRNLRGPMKIRHYAEMLTREGDYIMNVVKSGAILTAAFKSPFRTAEIKYLSGIRTVRLRRHMLHECFHSLRILRPLISDLL